MNLTTKIAAIALASSLTAATFAGGPGDFDAPQAFHPFSVSVNGGMNWPGVAIDGASDLFDTGYSVGGSFDYHFTPNWRAGLSVDYLSNAASDKPSGNDLTQLLVMANGYYDFTMGKFVPYIGLGLGMVHATIDSTFGGGASDNYFAWAAHLGVNYMLTDQLGLGLGYRFAVWTPPSDGDIAQASVYNNSVLANVSFHFGG